MKTFPHYPWAACLLVALALQGCAKVAAVSERRPRLQTASATGGAVPDTTQDIDAALREKKASPAEALGKLLTVAEAASRDLMRAPADAAALETYNFAVARAVAIMQEADLAPWQGARRIPSSGGGWLLSLKHDPRPNWNPALYEFVPADQFDVHGSFVSHRSAKAGLGAPGDLRRAGRDALRLATFQAGDLRLKRIPNSIDTLSPNNRFVKAVNTIPMRSGVPMHVISGDQGKGGNKDRTKPVMSDGVVPYWSSHMDGAVSELVVPSGHSAHRHPAAIEEVKRILDSHRKGA